jgi:hypothetical protein
MIDVFQVLNNVPVKIHGIFIAIYTTPLPSSFTVLKGAPHLGSRVPEQRLLIKKELPVVTFFSIRSTKIHFGTQSPVQRVTGALSLGVKRPGREANRSPLSSAEVKNAWSCTSTLPIHLHGLVLN